MKGLLILIGSFTSDLVNAQAQGDSVQTVQLKEMVVTASRLQENVATSPVSVERLSSREIQKTASPSFFDALEYVKGVQMLTPSMGFRVLNTRGFANTTNVRFSQMVDGIDNQAPHIGAPIANALGPSDLDIDRVEITPGVASALYGMNTINGLANFLTRDPFDFAGLSMSQKIGVNRVNSGEGVKPFSETSLRWAEKVNSKLAFKINGTFTSGTDWVANDKTILNPKANASTSLFGYDNPAIDPVNSYGNESSNRRTVSLGGKNYAVARTGYYERDVLDYSIRNFKGDAAIHYKINPDMRLTYSARYAHLDNVYQRSNRFRLENYQLQQHSLSFVSNSVQLRTYFTMENTGDSYNARSMAENIDRSFKSDDNWFNDYTSRYNTSNTDGLSVADSHRAARAFADAGRPVPGSPDFNARIDNLRDINNWDYGAALRVKSRMLHAESLVNLTEKLLQSFYLKTKINLLTGFDQRTYFIIPDGNYFINPVDTGQNIVYKRFGAFFQAQRTFLDGKLKAGATIRVDKNNYFSAKWNPRFTLVYSATDKHNLRFSYQSGYRFPSLFEAYSNVNSGGVRRVGGLPVMSNGIFENAYLRASIDAFQTAVTTAINTGGLTKNQAIVQESGRLVKNSYTYINPEHIQSFEFGYRSLLLNEKLEIDVDFYFNRYSQFIAQVEMNIPKTSKPDSIAFYLNDKKEQDRYRMWTNSKTLVYNYGSSVGIKYSLPSYMQLNMNATYSRLQRKENNDGLEDGYNTPRWMVNASLSKEKILGLLAFQATYRWQSSFYWQSFLVNGNVPAYQTVDAQVSIPVNKVRFKIGGTNVLNQYYRSFLGGPQVGGFYYMTATFGM